MTRPFTAEQHTAAIRKTTRMLVGQGVDVTTQGAKAYIAWNTKTGEINRINLPMVPRDASPEFLAALQGFLDHEAGHAHYTRPIEGRKLEQQAVKDHGLPEDYVRSMANIVEDVRIEACMEKDYPGSPANLEAVRRFFTSTFTKVQMDKVEAEPDLSEDDKEQARRSLLMPVWMRARGGQSACSHFMDDNGYWPVMQRFDDLMPDLTDRLKSLKSTEDAVRLAVDLLVKAKDASPPPPPMPSDEQDDEQEPQKNDGRPEGDDEKDDCDDADKGDDEDEAGESEDEDEGEGASEADEDGDEEEQGDEEDGDDAGSDADADDEDDDYGDDEDDAEDEGESNSDGADRDEEVNEADADEGDDAEDDADEEAEDGDGDGQADNADDEDADDAEDESEADASTGDEDAEEGEDSETEAEVEIKGNGLTMDQDKLRDFDEVMAEVLEAAAVNTTTTDPYYVFTRDLDVIEPAKAPENAPVEQMMERVNKTAGALRKNLERLIAARSLSTQVSGFRKGKIHPGSLHRVTTNDDRLFSKRHEAIAKDTAVSLLVDCSGSMHGVAGRGGSSTKIQVAMDAAAVFADTLSRIKVPCEALGFTTCVDKFFEKIRTDPTFEKEARRYAELNNCEGQDRIRLEGLYIPVLKSFDEGFDQNVKRRLAHYPIGGKSSANIDGESVRIAASRLYQRKERRKVLIVFSDGQPAGSVEMRYLQTDLAKAVKECADAGIECIGIGIADKSVTHYYPKSFVINSVEELTGTMMGQLKALLTA